MIRELEEMIVKLKSGVYEPIIDYSYRGPTHVSIGQEASAVGVSTGLNIFDKITSTHRGHGDSLAKGTSAIFSMNTSELSARLNKNINHRFGYMIQQNNDKITYLGNLIKSLNPKNIMKRGKKTIVA